MDYWRQDPAAREKGVVGPAWLTRDEARLPPPVVSIAETCLAMSSNSTSEGSPQKLGTNREQIGNKLPKNTREIGRPTRT